MTMAVGIGMAFVAMLCWGIGDFTVQKSARKLGNWETLFVITGFGTLILIPFVYKSFWQVVTGPMDAIIILFATGFILLCGALCIIEGFKTGKVSVLEPLMSFEIISASMLAFFVLHDQITILQIGLILILLIGLALVSFRETKISKTFFMEKGVIIFLCGAVLTGFADFLLGWGSRVTDPLTANFVINIVILFFSTLAIILLRKTKRLIHDMKSNVSLLLVMAITDNIAWISYAFAMTLIPIAIATGLSETSIIVAVILGVSLNKERLQDHQKIGLVIALVSVVVLAFVSS